MPNASLISEGTMPTQTALFSRSLGILLSGVRMISFTTAVAFASCCALSLPFPFASVVPQSPRHTRARISLFIAHLLVLRALEFRGNLWARHRFARETGDLASSRCEQLSAACVDR